jgi:hypothetical protein
MLDDDMLTETLSFAMRQGFGRLHADLAQVRKSLIS